MNSPCQQDTQALAHTGHERSSSFTRTCLIRSPSRPVRKTRPSRHTRPCVSWRVRTVPALCLPSSRSVHVMPLETASRAVWRTSPCRSLPPPAPGTSAELERCRVVAHTCIIRMWTAESRLPAPWGAQICFGQVGLYPSLHAQLCSSFLRASCTRTSTQPPSDSSQAPTPVSQ